MRLQRRFATPAPIPTNLFDGPSPPAQGSWEDDHALPICYSCRTSGALATVPGCLSHQRVRQGQASTATGTALLILTRYSLPTLRHKTKVDATLMQQVQHRCTVPISLGHCCQRRVQHRRSTSLRARTGGHTVARVGGPILLCCSGGIPLLGGGKEGKAEGEEKKA